MNGERLYSHQQIAEALGVGRRAVHKRASEGRRKKGKLIELPWPIAKKESGLGGWTTYHRFDDLPRDVQKAIDNWEERQAARAKMQEIEAEHAQIAAEQAEQWAEQKKQQADEETLARIRCHQEGRRQFSQLKKDDPKRLRAKGREWLISATIDLCRDEYMTKEKARIEITRRVNAHEIPLPPFVAEAIPQRHGKRSLSQRTLQTWMVDYNNEGIWGLVSNHGNRKGSGKIETNPALMRVVLGALIKYPQTTAKSVKDFLKAHHPELDICDTRTIQRFFTRFKEENPQIWTYMTHPDRWKNIYMAGVGSVFEQINRPNQLWELDSTPGDWLLTDGRHSVVGCIDMHTRRVKLFVSKSSTAAAVKQVLRRSMLDWGVPEAVRTDNGKDYVSEDVTSLLRDLDIMQQICIPFASEEKGTIERFFRTMSHGILNLLDGFIGHSVADRKAIEARKSFAKRIMKKDAVVEVKLSAAELQEKLDQWVAFYYEQEPHGGLKGQSPIEVWRAWSQPLRKITDDHALDELMAEVAGTRTIGKKGIRYDNRFYIDPAGVMHEHVGREVLVRLDEQDLGRLAIYLDGAFLCWAVDPDHQGIDRREAAAAIKGHVKKRAAEQAAELKRYTKVIKQDIVQTVIDHRKAQVENIVDLPKRAESHSTPALDAAGDAASTRATPPEPPRQESEAEILQYQEFRGEFREHNRAVMEDEDERRTFARWQRVKDSIEAGRLVSAEDRRGLEIYIQSGQYQSMQEFFDAFGLTEEDFPE